MISQTKNTKSLSIPTTTKIDDEFILIERRKNRLNKFKKNPKLIDVFSGAGGLSVGFSNYFGHCFESVWANDFNRESVNTYNQNFGNHSVLGDISKILRDKNTNIPHADIVIGGPPCQGFSLLNKNREFDDRKELWREFMKVVEMSGAEIFVMENVPQIINSDQHFKILRRAKKMGFQLSWSILTATDYGVPQSRKRAFIVGCKFADPAKFFPPKKTNYKLSGKLNYQNLDLFSTYIKNPTPWKTVRDVIGQLPSPIGTEIRNVDSPLNLHFGRNPTEKSKARYRAIPKEGMNRVDLLLRAPELTPACWVRKKSGGTDLFGRMWWDRPSHTIRTEFFKPEKGRYLHPKEHRPITHREASRIQTFPDNFQFTGSKIEIAKQIGNAVPPLLAARVADSIFAMILSKNKS